MTKYASIEDKAEAMMHATSTAGGFQCRPCFRHRGSIFGYVYAGAMWHPMTWSIHGTANGKVYGTEREHLALLCPATRPSEFALKMADYDHTDQDSDGDHYDVQVRSTMYLCDVLRENGYGEGVDTFMTMFERWMA